MRLAQSTGSRLALADRTAATRAQSYHGTAVSQHALTTRWTYTVPAGRKTMVASLLAQMHQDTAGTGTGESIAVIQLTPSVGSLAAILDAFTDQTAVSLPAPSTLSPALTLQPGDTLAGATASTFTTSTISASAAWSGTEGDA